MMLDLIGPNRIPFPGLTRKFDSDSFRFAAVRCFNEEAFALISQLEKNVAALGHYYH